MSKKNVIGLILILCATASLGAAANRWMAASAGAAKKGADTVSITSINEKTGSVTVKNDATGRSVHFKITNATALKSLRVGQVIAAPASAQPKAMHRRSGLGIGPQSPNTCFEDCMAAPQTTILQCMYWCATRWR
jgi:hypothetical protein